jgi:hypothetical protein
MTPDDAELARLLAPDIDEMRLRRLRTGVLSRTAPPARRRWREPAEWLPLAAGVVLALGLTWAVEVARPAQAEVHPFVALLDSESIGLGVW